MWYGEVSEEEKKDTEDVEEKNDLQDVLYAKLADIAFKHELLQPKAKEEDEILYELEGECSFDGIVVDHGGRKYSQWPKAIWGLLQTYENVDRSHSPEREDL